MLARKGSGKGAVGKGPAAHGVALDTVRPLEGFLGKAGGRAQLAAHRLRPGEVPRDERQARVFASLDGPFAEPFEHLDRLRWLPFVEPHEAGDQARLHLGQDLAVGILQLQGARDLGLVEAGPEQEARHRRDRECLG